MKEYIKTTILKSATAKRDVLISVCIFKMDNPYAHFIKYEINLLKFLRNIPIFANVRVYVDDTTEYLAKTKEAKLSYVEFYKYEYAPLKLNVGHWGTFGTIVRFLPVFYWPSGYKYVWVSDIDININIGLSYSYIQQMEKADISYVSLLEYNKPWTGGIKLPIINYRFITKTGIDKSILLTFLDSLIDGKLQDVIETIIIYNNEKSKNGFIYTKLDINILEKFPYGTDELFTNQFLLRYLKTTNLTVSVFVFMDIIRIIKIKNKENGLIKSYITLDFNELESLWFTIYYGTNDNVTISKKYIELCLKIIKLLEDNNLKYSILDDFKNMCNNLSYTGHIHHIKIIKLNLLE